MREVRVQEPLEHEAGRRALKAIYAALDELEAGGLSDLLPRAPDTLLIGDGGLESLAFVTFAVTLEEQLHRSGWLVSIFDLLPPDVETYTIGQLAERICDVAERGR